MRIEPADDSKKLSLLEFECVEKDAQHVPARSLVALGLRPQHVRFVVFRDVPR